MMAVEEEASCRRATKQIEQRDWRAANEECVLWSRVRSSESDRNGRSAIEADLANHVYVGFDWRSNWRTIHEQQACL